MDVVFQQGSNMHRIEGHHFASRFALFPGGGKQWIRSGDPVEIAGPPTEKGGFQVQLKRFANGLDLVVTDSFRS